MASFHPILMITAESRMVTVFYLNKAFHLLNEWKNASIYGKI